ncbi:MAG: formimidoylglutamase [Cyclobacteriaceae bacterium]|nr:formimidoylglutamase [Cyclobacteriaceae bacterium]
MDLTILFSPLDESVYHDISSAGAFFKSISCFGEKMPDYQSADIAIFGIGEGRGHDANAATASGPDAIRRKLYRLRRGTGRYAVADLGNLKPGHDLDETYTRISEVCRILLENNTLPVLLGGSHDLDYGQYRGYEDMEKLISLLSIDATIDLDDNKAAPPAASHTHRILLHEPNYLFSYTHLAHQSYLVDPGAAAVLEKLYFDAYRVGQLRTNMADMEPAIRNADMLSFDITAIRSADAPGNAMAQPFGLTGEEACQICWYAGMNEKLSSAGFYEYNPALDDAHGKTASVIATMIWYFIEGFYNRKNDRNFRGNDFLKYTVSMPVEPEILTFYKSKFTERWWMEIPVHGRTDRLGRNSIVPCTYQDYQMATKGEVPARYITALSRLI